MGRVIETHFFFVFFFFLFYLLRIVTFTSEIENEKPFKVCIRECDPHLMS